MFFQFYASRDTKKKSREVMYFGTIFVRSCALIENEEKEILKTTGVVSSYD